MSRLAASSTAHRAAHRAAAEPSTPITTVGCVWEPFIVSSGVGPCRRGGEPTAVCGKAIDNSRVFQGPLVLGLPAVGHNVVVPRPGRVGNCWFVGSYIR